MVSAEVDIFRIGFCETGIGIVVDYLHYFAIWELRYRVKWSPNVKIFSKSDALCIKTSSIFQDREKRNDR